MKKISFFISNFSFLILCFFLLLSCTRTSDKNFSESDVIAPPPPPPAARPMAILRTGGQPLWFQLTEEGPVHIESIEDAVFSSALIPWPFAPHIRFLQEREGALVMTVNRHGFLKIAPNGGDGGLALYSFPGGDLWRQYTVGGFVFYDDKPAAVLYLDEFFLDSAAPVPRPRAWTFNMESNTPFPLEIPALRPFPEEEDWNADTLRLGSDGLIYYRAAKRRGSRPEIRMLRTVNLALAGEEISSEVFYNSAPRQDDFSHPSLPPLPEGFFYTSLGIVADSLFAGWEEQEDYNIGAAGFVVIKR